MKFIGFLAAALLAISTAQAQTEREINDAYEVCLPILKACPARSGRTAEPAECQVDKVRNCRTINQAWEKTQSGKQAAEKAVKDAADHAKIDAMAKRLRGDAK
jgi:hypothetical protein